MLIAHINSAVARQDRDKALDMLLAGLPAVRRMPGCLTFLPFVDPIDPCRLGVMHEWSSADAFAAYTASPGFTETVMALRALMTEPPVSRRFDARLIETVR